MRCHVRRGSLVIDRPADRLPLGDGGGDDDDDDDIFDAEKRHDR
jgi:hypothetical protein